MTDSLSQDTFACLTASEKAVKLAQFGQGSGVSARVNVTSHIFLSNERSEAQGA